MIEILETNDSVDRQKITLKEIKVWIKCSFKKGAIAPIVVFTIHLLSSLLLDLYSVFPAFDIPMHFLGGLAITYFFIQSVMCASQNGLLGKPSLITLVILVFLLTSTTTIFWEFFEWSLDYFIGLHMQVSLDDTLLDMLLGILGAIVMLAITLRKRK